MENMFIELMKVNDFPFFLYFIDLVMYPSFIKDLRF